jgi:hypothetical protein
MKQPLFPSTIGTQSCFAYFLTVKAVVRKFSKSDGQTGSRCLDKAVLARGVKQRILSYHMTPVTQVIGHRQQHCSAALQHCLWGGGGYISD